jgi:hypothetical protein
MRGEGKKRLRHPEHSSARDQLKKRTRMRRRIERGISTADIVGANRARFVASSTSPTERNLCVIDHVGFNRQIVHTSQVADSKKRDILH